MLQNHILVYGLSSCFVQQRKEGQFGASAKCPAFLFIFRICAIANSFERSINQSEFFGLIAYFNSLIWTTFCYALVG